MRLILASGSPRRRELLGAFGLEFDVLPSAVDEEKLVREARPDGPTAIVTLLAAAKARDVAGRTRPGAAVLGADTIVWLDGVALNKPRDPEDAVRMLLLLGGRSHEVYTGLALAIVGSGGEALPDVACEMTQVEFHSLTESAARAYVATGEPMDKAGGYGIQDTSLGIRLVRAVRGDYYNVVGLPLNRLRTMLDPHFPNLPPAPAPPPIFAGDR